MTALVSDLVVDFGFFFNVTARVVFTVLPFFVVELTRLMAVINFPGVVLLVDPTFLVVDNREPGLSLPTVRATIYKSRKVRIFQGINQ